MQPLSHTSARRKLAIGLSVGLLSTIGVVGLAGSANAAPFHQASVNTCIAQGGFAAEAGDTAPTVNADGSLGFSGPSVPPIDYYQRLVTPVPASDITSLTVTYGTGGTGQPAQVVVEITSPAIAFATLSTNLTAPSGTVNVLDPSANIWSSTKITPISATNPGSLDDPISYTALIALFPGNTLLSAPSLHLLSNSTAGDTSTVDAISSSCGTTTFLTPAVVTPPSGGSSGGSLALTGGDPGSRLAFTGVTTGWLLYPGIAMLLAGGVAIGWAIRRNHADSQPEASE